MTKRIELLEIIGEKEGTEIYSAILHSDGHKHEGFAVVTNDGGTWTEGNPLDWDTLEECFEYHNGGIDATTDQPGADNPGNIK